MVRWVTRDQASDAGGDRGDIAGIPHSATGEKSHFLYALDSVYFATIWRFSSFL